MRSAVDAKPIKCFEAWLPQNEVTSTVRSGRVSWNYRPSSTKPWLGTQSPPLDYRALSALKHSALALDVYTWLAHRLCRIARPERSHAEPGENLRDQFGQEYTNSKDFKREFRNVLRQVPGSFIPPPESKRPLAESSFENHRPRSAKRGSAWRPCKVMWPVDNAARRTTYPR